MKMYDITASGFRVAGDYTSRSEAERGMNAILPMATANAALGGYRLPLAIREFEVTEDDGE